MAGLITQSMSGRPASGLMFFLGMDTEPPRAGIIAMTRGLAVAILLVRAVAMAKLSLRTSSGQRRGKEFIVRGMVGSASTCHPAAAARRSPKGV